MKAGKKEGERIGLQKFVFPQVVNTTREQTPSPTLRTTFFPGSASRQKENTATLHSPWVTQAAGTCSQHTKRMREAEDHTRGGVRAPPLAGRPTPILGGGQPVTVTFGQAPGLGHSRGLRHRRGPSQSARRAGPAAARGT